MNEEAAFVTRIIAEPDEDTHRLVFADWLDEQGRDLLAEFIRVQVELAQLDGCVDRCRERIDFCCDTCLREQLLREREQQLLIGSPKGTWSANAWFADWLSARGHRWNNADPLWQWSRGFVYHFVSNAADWLAHGAAICAAHPVRQVRLTTAPTWNYADKPGGTRVMLNGGSRVYDIHTDLFIRVGDPVVPALLAAEYPGVKLFEYPLP